MLRPWQQRCPSTACLLHLFKPACWLPHCTSRPQSQNALSCHPPTHHMQVPELNVQNGVLKALSFLFEYIGEMGKDYIYSGK